MRLIGSIDHECSLIGAYLLQYVDGQTVSIDVVGHELLAEPLQTGESVIGRQFGGTELGVILAIGQNGELGLGRCTCMEGMFQ